ncbi:MAG: polysaccharide deacetylase family protein [Clostridia bacterium]|nr:polysaccharide deacetylase family protein [Clostridia bacterium]MBO5416037.1 polysaccharide deacetylase family protein [Clostridia bacterium]
MATFLRYPGFKRKAVTLSYDDAVDFDKKLIEIMGEYGLKGTFNVNHAGIGKDGWHSMSEDELFKMYLDSGNEIAVHGAEHFSLGEVDVAMATRDILLNREFLEKKTGGIVRGMAYANGSCDQRIADIVKNCGIVYARTVNSTRSFELPKNWLLLDPTTHHADSQLDSLVDRFLSIDKYRYMWSNSPKLFYLWGHSFEFETGNNWHIIEDFAKKISGREDIWYATNIEIYNYVSAYDSLIYSCDGSIITNPTCTDIYLEYFGKEIIVPAGQSVMAR